MNAPVHNQKGISLVEAMVALVVLAIGMLGIAALHVESVKANRTALLRTQAVNLANDLADRIRANRQAGVSYRLAIGALPAVGNCVVTNNCTNAELAVDDLARWVRAVRVVLPPSPDGTPPTTLVGVVPAAAAGQPDTYRIRVEWREPGEPQASRYEVNMQLLPAAPL
jgi:type IV pilus assembly protein PilV